jgi:hypothetical protein
MTVISATCKDGMQQSKSRGVAFDLRETGGQRTLRLLHFLGVPIVEKIDP